MIETAVTRARSRKAALVIVMLVGSAGCGDSPDDERTAHDPLEAEAPQAVREADAGAYPTPPKPADAGLMVPPGWPPKVPDGTVVDAGRDAGGGEVCGPSAPPDAGHPMMFCTGKVFGDGKTCASLDLLKQLAVAACGSDGLTLIDMKVGDECEGGATTGWASCCDAYDVPTPVDAGMARAGCMGLALGGRKECTPDYEFRQIAYDLCAAEGLVLSDLTVGTPCPGGALDAQGSCCPMAAGVEVSTSF